MRNNTSTEQALRRRLAILALLHHCPRATEDIITSLAKGHFFYHDHALDEMKIAQLRKYQLQQDIEALRILGCDVRYDRKSKCYRWHNSPFGLFLDLPQLTTFATLLDTFTHTTILHADEIRNLLNFFVDLLPLEQKKRLGELRKSFRIDLQETTDYRSADSKTIEAIELAIRQRQRLEFLYCSPSKGQERRHIIEPQPLVFERGHVYLKGWSIDRDKELQFRLDYILPGTATVLSLSIAPSRPAPRSYTLRYHLSAVIARNSVSEHFPQQQVDRHEDGSATITAQVTDLFVALRTLISYREHCIVLDPPELVAQMHDCIEKLYDIYHTQNKTVQLN